MVREKNNDCNDNHLSLPKENIMLKKTVIALVTLVGLGAISRVILTHLSES